MSLLKLLGIDKYTTRLKEWVNSQIDKKHAEFVGAAPEQLNTINELAAALGNDENFASTVTNELSKKINKEDVVFEKGESDNSAVLKGVSCSVKGRPCFDNAAAFCCSTFKT